jgi:hypothetical protein
MITLSLHDDICYNLITLTYNYCKFIQRHREDDFAGAVCIPDYYTDAPQAWFRSINTTPVSHVTKPLTKFYWTLSKLLSTLVDTIGPLFDDASTTANPYTKLHCIVLFSYGLSDHQRTVKWLDHPRPRGEQAIGPDGPAQCREACIGGRHPKSLIPPQDARLLLGQPAGFPGPTHPHKAVKRDTEE